MTRSAKRDIRFTAIDNITRKNVLFFFRKIEKKIVIFIIFARTPITGPLPRKIEPCIPPAQSDTAVVPKSIAPCTKTSVVVHDTAAPRHFMSARSRGGASRTNLVAAPDVVCGVTIIILLLL